MSGTEQTKDFWLAHIFRSPALGDPGVWRLRETMYSRPQESGACRYENRTKSNN
jgi:hypothetical protein